MEEQQEEKVHKSYKINEGDIISVIRQDVTKDGNTWTFYKVALKNKLDDTQTYYKNITFPKGTEIKDGTKIKIKNMVEYARHIDKFRDTFYLYVDDFEIIGEIPKEAIQEYRVETQTSDDYLF